MNSQKMIFWILPFLVTMLGCASRTPLEEYVEKNYSTLPSEKILAMQNLQIINGMTQEEVELVLGKPTHMDQESKKWIYRGKDVGIEQQKAYASPSSFPSGIGVILPLYYRSKELCIQFQDHIVCRVEQILNF